MFHSFIDGVLTCWITKGWRTWDKFIPEV